jgi:hypothetical protein
VTLHLLSVCPHIPETHVHLKKTLPKVSAARRNDGSFKHEDKSASTIMKLCRTSDLFQLRIHSESMNLSDIRLGFLNAASSIYTVENKTEELGHTSMSQSESESVRECSNCPRSNRAQTTRPLKQIVLAKHVG